MQKILLVFPITFLLLACGAEEGTITPTVLSLNSIGNKTATIDGQALNFSINAIDPDSLSFSYSSVGRVGSSPYDFGATFNESTGTFNWDATSANNVTAGNYFVTFTVTNTNLDTDSEEIQITVQAQPGQLLAGETLYNDRCLSCHGPGGRMGTETIIQCIDSATYYEAIEGGSMTQYVNSWSPADKDDVLNYLNMVEPTRC